MGDVERPAPFKDIVVVVEEDPIRETGATVKAVHDDVDASATATQRTPERTILSEAMG